MGVKGKEKEAKETTTSPIERLAIEGEPYTALFARRLPGAHLTEEQEQAIVKLLTLSGGHIAQVARMTGVGKTEVFNVKQANYGAFDEQRERFKRAAAVEAQEVFALATDRVRDTIHEASARDSAVIAGIYADKGALFAGDNVQTIRHLHGVDPVALGDVLTRLQSLTATSIEETGDIVPGTFVVKD